MDTFPVRLDGLDIEFQCKRLKLRGFKKMLGLLEDIRTSGISSKTMQLIQEGLDEVVESPKELDDIIDFEQAMQLIGKAVGGGRVSDDERKKSE
jgi:hypothetical protein